MSVSLYPNSFYLARDFLYYGDPGEENRQRMWDTLQSCTDNAGMTNIRLEDERRDMQASASASETRNACGRPD